MDDNHEETLQLLLTRTLRRARDNDEAGDDDDADLTDRLRKLVPQLSKPEEDPAIATHWDSLVRDLEGLGFSWSATAPPAALASPKNPAPPTPASFDTDQGQAHLRAASQLLGVSPDEAARCTLSALARRSTTSSSSDDPRQWIGSRALLDLVLEHAYAQRAARLQLLAECLRLEQQDTEDTWRDEVLGPVLEQLDQVAAVQDPFENAPPRNRGLFRLLLSLGTQPLVVPWSRQQLECCRSLTEVTPTSLEGTIFSRSPQASWDAYVHQLMQGRLTAMAQERLLALEALVALLYVRLDGGMRRADWALLLLALQSADNFYATASVASSQLDTKRLTSLAGLLCIEGTGLWRVADGNGDEDDSADASSRVERHPMLLGIVDCRCADRAETEIEAILTLLRKYGRQASLRQEQRPGDAVPESLALFSFGLLLCSAHRHLLASERHGSNASAYWQTFQDSGTELSRYANDVCQAMEYMDAALKCLVEVPPFVVAPKDPNSLEAFPYEVNYLFKDVLRLRNESAADDSEMEAAGRELNGPSLVYASIGRELLVAMVVVFRDTILSVHHPGALDNLRMLSQLSSHIFCNSPTLCNPFWEDWYRYHSTESLPLCCVLDSAIFFAKSVLHSSQPPDNVLQAAAPLLTFVSCLVHDSTITNYVLTQVLPPNLIRSALEACSSLSSSDLSSGLCAEVLASVALLAQVGNSKSTRQQLRNILDVSTPSSPLLSRSVPRLLVSMADAQPSCMQVAGLVDSLLSVLLLDAPESWIMDAVISLQAVTRSPIPSSFHASDYKRVESHLNLVRCFVSRTTQILAHEEHDEASKQTFLKYLEQGLSLACSFLMGSMAPYQVTTCCTPYETVLVALECLEGFLSAVFVLNQLLDKEANSFDETLDRMRLALLNNLATNREFGDAIWYYSCCPVSLILASDLVDILRDADRVPESTSSFGASHSSMLQIPTPRSEERDLSKACSLFEKSALLCSKGYEMDLEGVIKKGWIRPDADTVLFHVSLTALQLLNAWARNAEAIVMNSDMDFNWLTLSPFRLLLKQTVVPPLCRMVQHVAKVWNISGVTNLSVLLHFITINESRLPMSLITAAFDLLVFSFSHAMKSPCRDSSVFHACCSSALFKAAVEDSLAAVSRVAEHSRITLPSCVKACFAMRLIQAVSLCIDSSPRTLLLLFGATPSSRIATLFRIVVQVIEELLQLAGLQQRPDPSTVFDDLVLINRLKLGNGCLRLIQSLWKVARSEGVAFVGLNWVERSIIEESSSLSQFARMVFQSTNLWFIDATTESAQLGQRLCFSFASLCLELLATEINWTCTTLPNLTSDSPLVVALQVALDQQQSLIAGKTCDYSTFWTLRRYATVQKAVRSKARLGSSVAATLDIRALTSTGSIIVPDGITELNGYDVFASPGLRSFLGVVESSRSDLRVTLRDLAVTSSLFAADLRRIQAWHIFSESFCFLLQTQKLERLLHITSLLSLDIGKEASNALHHNVTQVDHLKKENLSSLELNDFLSVVSASSRMILLYAFAFVSVQETQSDDETLFEALVSQSDSIAKIVTILGPQLPLGFESLQNLVASAAALLSLPKSDRAYQVSPCREDVCLCLAVSCCDLLKNAKSINADRIDFNDCCSTCVSLLTALTAEVSPHGSDPRSESLPYFGKLYDTFRKNEITATVLRQVTSSSVLSPSLDAKLLSPAVSFFTSIASIGDEKFMELVMDVAPRVLTRCASHYASIMDKIQEVKGSSFGGATADANQDVLSHQLIGGARYGSAAHESWLEGLAFLSAMLVSSNSLPTPIRPRLLAVATNFLNSFKGSIRACLQSICEKAPDSSVPVFTLSSLYETKLLLSILSEVSACQGGTPLHSECAEVHSSVLSCCRHLLANLGSFLGASAAARGLFKLLNEYESAGEVADLQLVPLSPLYHLLMTSGVPTAKHEAIRFSHFASRSSKATNESEMKAQSEVMDNWGPPLAERVADSRSLSNLQHVCRRSVTSQFAFDMEFAAAEALFFAIRFLRNVHPSSSCFVPLSEIEARNLDAITLVRPGAVISFRPPASGLSGCPASPGTGFEEPAISYGEVLFSDTIRRQWRVRELGQDSEDRLVSDYQLAGIEDLAKRQCLLAYAPAPETSSDLEAAIGTPSVGHLILALRWCDQTHSEIQASSELASRSVIVQRLAEIVAALLGTEVSLHRLIGSHGSASKSGTLQVLTSQLADLFGEVSDTVSGTSGQRGCLKAMLGDSVPKIRELFRGDLEAVRLQAERNRASPRRRTGIDSWRDGAPKSENERLLISK